MFAVGVLAFPFVDVMGHGMQILDEIRTKLFVQTLYDEDQASLASAYATVLGQAPAVEAWKRIDELFDRLGRLDVAGERIREGQPIAWLRVA